MAEPYDRILADGECSLLHWRQERRRNDVPLPSTFSIADDHTRLAQRCTTRACGRCVRGKRAGEAPKDDHGSCCRREWERVRHQRARRWRRRRIDWCRVLSPIMGIGPGECSRQRRITLHRRMPNGFGSRLVPWLLSHAQRDCPLVEGRGQRAPANPGTRRRTSSHQFLRRRQTHSNEAGHVSPSFA